MGWVLLKKNRFFPTLKQTPINLRQCVSAFKWFFTINFHMSLFLRSNSSSIKHFRIWPFLVGSKNMILSMFFSQYHYLTIDTYLWLTSKSCNMFSGDISLLRLLILMFFYAHWLIKTYSIYLKLHIFQAYLVENMNI